MVIMKVYKKREERNAYNISKGNINSSRGNYLSVIGSMGCISYLSVTTPRIGINICEIGGWEKAGWEIHLRS